MPYSAAELAPILEATTAIHEGSTDAASDGCCIPLRNCVLFTEPLPAVEEATQAGDNLRLFRERVTKYLPAWAYETEPLEHAQANDMWGTDRALVWCYSGTALIWVFLVVFSLIAWSFSACDKTGFAFVPKWLVGIYAPVLFMHMYIEWKALKYTIVAQAMYTAPFELMFSKVQYVVWLFASMSISLVGHMDVTTTGLVIAKVLRSKDCRVDGRWTPSEIWEHTVKQSLLGPVPFMSDFAVVFLVSAGVIAFQPIYSLLCVVPIRRQTARFFDTCLLSEQTASGATLQLAELNRMATITIQDTKYLAQASRHWRSAVIYGHLQRTVTKFVLMSVLEASIQTNLQASLVGVDKSLDVLEDEHYNADQDNFVLLSFVLSFLSAMYGLLQTCKKVAMLFSSLRRATFDVDTSDVERAMNESVDTQIGLQKLCEAHGAIDQLDKQGWQEAKSQATPSEDLKMVAQAVKLCLKDTGKERAEWKELNAWDTFRRSEFFFLRELQPSDLSTEAKAKLKAMVDEGSLDPDRAKLKATKLFCKFLCAFSDANANFEAIKQEFEVQCEMERANAKRNFINGQLVYVTFWIVTIVYVFMLSYAMFKMVMVSRCEYGVWNLLGCVDLGTLRGS